MSFASSVNSLIPTAPQSMLCGLWSVQSEKLKNQDCLGGWGGGGNVFKTLENRILLPSVSTILSLSERLLFGLVSSGHENLLAYLF